MSISSISLILLVLLSGQSKLISHALDNGLALTPPMGWLAWERYVCETNCIDYPDECINADLFLTMANRMVDDGFKQLGYHYVNIDDCWSLKKRDPNTKALVPDPQRFADINKLSADIHSLGMKIGIYGDCGTQTCQGFPGQLENSSSLVGNHFELDAQTFAHWQVDSFKFDGCYLDIKRAAHICPFMGDKLNATGRPMLFSCSWPAYENDEQLPTNWSLVVEKCNLWRAFGDIEDSWKSVIETVDYFVKEQDLVVKYHGPGHWFDADQLVIGDFGLSADQERAQMAIWCIWASPLYMSNDLRNISAESKDILQNKWAIQVNQDKFGIFGMVVETYGKYLQVFVKPVEPVTNSCPSYAIIYFDRRTLGNFRTQSFRLADLIGGIHQKLDVIPKWSSWSKCATRNVTFDVFDIFNDNKKIGDSLSLISDRLKLRVAPSGVRMVKLVQSSA